jgi:hypothetical protein
VTSSDAVERGLAAPEEILVSGYLRELVEDRGGFTFELPSGFRTNTSVSFRQTGPESVPDRTNCLEVSTS